MLNNMKRTLLTWLMTFCLAVFTVQADVLGVYSFEGTLGDKIPMTLKFAVNGDEIAVGEVLYLNAKKPAPILVVGFLKEDGSYVLEEYQNDGTITGIMNFKIEGEDTAGGAYISEGTWLNPKTEKSFPMNHFESNEEMVDVPYFLDYEDPQNIGREYAYRLYNPRYEEMMGGTVKFRGAGKHKLHFEVYNAPGYVAQGKSDPDRPAVLGDYTYDFFYYENVNECGYGFAAYFFKKFVVLKSLTTEPETYDCFDKGMSFDGVYIKVKQ